MTAIRLRLGPLQIDVVQRHVDSFPGAVADDGSAIEFEVSRLDDMRDWMAVAVKDAADACRREYTPWNVAILTAAERLSAAYWSDRRNVLKLGRETADRPASDPRDASLCRHCGTPRTDGVRHDLRSDWRCGACGARGVGQ